MPSVPKYVERNFGKTQAKRLAAIRQGGDNNQKGGRFENHYAVYRICAIAANDPQGNLQEHVVSSQEVSFVDDFSVQSLSRKTNYQAKNSAGNAADWTDDTSCRFKMQNAIDRDVHGFADNQQILLVSSLEKALKNKDKIPKDMKAFAAVEYFPDCLTPSLLLQTYDPLKTVMEDICTDSNLSTLDAGFKLVLAAWCGSDGKELTIHDLLTEAKRLSKPNLFKVGVQEATIPDWLEKLCTSFSGCTIRVEFGSFKISYKGLEVRCDAQLLGNKPDDEILASIASPMALIQWIMGVMEGGLS